MAGNVLSLVGEGEIYGVNHSLRISENLADARRD